MKKIIAAFVIGLVLGSLSQATTYAQRIMIGYGLSSGIPIPISLSSTGAINAAAQ
jgi:hypothetical protein